MLAAGYDLDGVHLNCLLRELLLQWVVEVAVGDFANGHALLGLRLVCALRENAAALDDAAASAHAAALIRAALGLDRVSRWGLDVVPADLDDATGLAGFLGLA